MATLYSCARPYAAAVFDVAQADNQLAEWHALLQTWVLIISDQAVTEQLRNPAFTYEQVESLLLAVVPFFPDLKEKAARFITTLKVNRRFNLLMEISNQYEMKLHHSTGTSLVHVTTAVPVSEEWLSKLEQVLIKKLNCQVIFECEIDETVLAGAIIKIGDRVIDASVHNKLTRLLEFSLR